MSWFVLDFLFVQLASCIAVYFLRHIEYIQILPPWTRNNPIFLRNSLRRYVVSFPATSEEHERITSNQIENEKCGIKVECTFNTWISLEKCRVQGFDPLKPTIFFVLHSSFIFSSLIDHCSLSHCNNNQQHRKHRTAQKIQTTGYRTTHRTVIQYNNIHYCWLQLYSNNVRPKPKPKPKRWWISNIQSKSKCRTSHWQQCRRWHPSSNGINGQSSWISRAWSNQGEWFLCCFWGSVTSCQETQCK